jgi:hypothetical protein
MGDMIHTCAFSLPMDHKSNTQANNLLGLQSLCQEAPPLAIVLSYHTLSNDKYQLASWPQLQDDAVDINV